MVSVYCSQHRGKHPQVKTIRQIQRFFFHLKWTRWTCPHEWHSESKGYRASTTIHNRIEAGESCTYKYVIRQSDMTVIMRKRATHHRAGRRVRLRGVQSMLGGGGAALSRPAGNSTVRGTCNVGIAGLLLPDLGSESRARSW